MSIEKLKNSLPEYAKDIRLNLGNIFTEEGSLGLSWQQIYRIALSCAYALKNVSIIDAIIEDSSLYLSEQDIQSAKSAAVIMAMNNIYYRFTHLVSDKSYAKMPARLRMNIIVNPGIDKTDFELNCLSVSVLNGCGLCMDAHANELNKRGLSPEAIQSTVRIAAVLNAAAACLDCAY